MKHLGISLTDIDKIYIAGGLGNYIDISKARETGLIKAIGNSQIVKAGNSALAGCKEMTFSASDREIEAILPLVSHYSLETDPDFQDIYCENLFFSLETLKTKSLSKISLINYLVDNIHITEHE